MTDPFAVALGALFRAPGSAAAVYTPLGGEPIAIRVIRHQGTEERGNVGVLVDVERVMIRRSDIAMPTDGDRIEIGDNAYYIQGGPSLDVEGLTWACGLTAT